MRLRPTRENTMKSRLMLSLLAGTALMALQASPLHAADAALTGVISSDAEGTMEGVVVTARKDGAKFSVAVVTDAQGRYTFPANRLEPGHYSIAIRATG